MLALLVVQANLAQTLDPLLAAKALDGAALGVYVAREDGTELYARNPDLRLMPASNEKLLTVTYALAKYGPEARFSTRIWKTSAGWYVDTGGNPTLTYSQLASAREKLAIRAGAKIFVHQSFRPGVPPGWEWDDLPNKYAAQPAAFTVDRGSFELWASGGKLSLRPANYGVRIVLLGGAKTKVYYDPTRGVVRFAGPIPKATTRLDTLALPDPSAAAALALGGDLKMTDDPPPSGEPTLTLTSEPLAEIATECLQKSDNNIAENLLLMAAATEGPLGDDPYDIAVKRLSKFLIDTVGCSDGSVRPMDGSGLSRHNLVSPRALAKVLAFSKKRWGAAWTDMLATSGKGTLESRLAGSPFRGKTGSLNSVQAISGYSVDASGRSLVIVLVFNHAIAPASEIRAIQDSIVRNIESFRDGTDFDAHDYREGRHSH